MIDVANDANRLLKTLPVGGLVTDVKVAVVDGKRVINPALSQNKIRVIKDTHGKTSHLTAADLDALELYLESLQR